MDILGLDCVGVAEAIATRRIGAREAVQASLEALASWNTVINAVVALDAEAALAAADRVDAGALTGALAGVPMAHKDMYYRAGRPARCGSVIREGFVPDVTATALARLDATGAIDLGTLNMAEFAFNPTGLNDHTGHVRNPWNPARITGGSSSGSGAAVAARGVFAALGSDTGGSIRLPASICGVTGIKPTWGRVSRFGAMPLAGSLDTVGPLAVSARDCAAIMAAIAGADASDPDCATVPVADYLAATALPATGLTIGVARGFLWDGIDPGVAAILDDAIRAWREAGATVVEIDIDGLADLRALTSAIILAESASQHAPWLARHLKRYTPTVGERLTTGLAVPATTYLDALRLRGPLTDRFCASVFSRCDALLSPVLTEPVPTIEAADPRTEQGSRIAASLPRLTRIANYLGLPALSLPSGFTPDGLPCGQQIIGRPFDEATLFRLGANFQRLTDWHRRRPSRAAAEARPARPPG